MIQIKEAKKFFAPYSLWVLAPHLESDDPNIQYYYDFSQSILEYTRVFGELGIEWKWQPVTIQNYKEIIRSIADSGATKPPLVINLCDGDEINGTPGVSVIKELLKHGIIYTGANEHFYNITTSKIPMKRAFDIARVPTGKWSIISEKNGLLKNLCKRVGSPLLIKPAVSGGSMGISVKNVVYTEDELIKRIEQIKEGYRGWNLMADKLIAEEFISGPEFTVFITGSANDPDNCIIYEPIERVFHPSLPDTEKMLSFDRLWETYEDESPMPGNKYFYEYQPVNKQLIKELKRLSFDAYKACDGKGYTRIDIRQNSKSGKLLVLEVNAQCGISEDEDYTSIGAILKVSGVTFTQIVAEIMMDAVRRSQVKEKKSKKGISQKKKKKISLK